MRLVLTEKAERDGLGTAGVDVASKYTEAMTEYLLLHGYAVESHDPAPAPATIADPVESAGGPAAPDVEDSTLLSPPEDAMLRHRGER